jgi:hypothetical protein
VQSRVFGGTLRWVGEHWVCGLQGEEEGETARVSLYHTHASPEGEGVVAYVSIRGQSVPPVLGVYTDNRALAAWVHGAWGGGRGGPFGQDPPVFDARLVRADHLAGGDRAADERSWTIQATDLDVNVVWHAFETPVVSYRGDDPAVYAQRSLFNVLLFAREAEIHVNGVRVPGAPYADGRWQPVIGGGDRSSCVVALAETFITPA